MCLVTLVLDIRLNILTFKFLTISGSHSFACGFMILLQLLLHLLILILKGKRILFTTNVDNLWSYFALLIVH